VSEIVSEIAASSREQAARIEEVNTSISEMDRVTQQNAASAEESSSAASELNSQAEELAAMVGTFQIGRRLAAGHAHRSGRSRPAPPPRSGFAAPRAALPDPFPMTPPQDLQDF
jgi:methyl-accepting chemotaxis protein